MENRLQSRNFGSYSIFICHKQTYHRRWLLIFGILYGRRESKNHKIWNTNHLCDNSTTRDGRILRCTHSIFTWYWNITTYNYRYFCFHWRTTDQLDILERLQHCSTNATLSFSILLAQHNLPPILVSD